MARPPTGILASRGRLLRLLVVVVVLFERTNDCVVVVVVVVVVVACKVIASCWCLLCWLGSPFVHPSVGVTTSSSSLVVSTYGVPNCKERSYSSSSSLIQTLTWPKNNNVTFSFRGDTQKPLQKKPSRRRRKKEEKDVGIVRSHPRLVHGRTPPPPVLVSMRVRRQKARVLSSFS